uniref:ATP synthase complex subunit 8 n=2 Tax=Endopterygota TaxID=33392 RepID=A0A2U8XE97_9CUCU|nr:ATP synthase F0 subunit 8 [Colaspis sp. DPP-2018]AWN56266.1 ATP synthase F0 subunit 8 [Glena unipennaria]
MPQMSPLNWLILFIFFFFMLIIFCIMNFFSLNYNPNMNKFNMKNIQKNWKW